VALLIGEDCSWAVLMQSPARPNWKNVVWPTFIYLFAVHSYNVLESIKFHTISDIERKLDEEETNAIQNFSYSTAVCGT
jgi:hypothetical protein